MRVFLLYVAGAVYHGRHRNSETSMNTFDFYSVQVSANTITALKKAGIDRSKIERRKNGIAVYGNRSFIRWIYVSTVGYFGLDATEQADELAGKYKSMGVSASVRYHAVD